MLIQQVHGNQVAALGQFNRPGRYSLETSQVHLSEHIAQAGGIAPTGSDTAIFLGVRDGKSMWRVIDVGGMFVRNRVDDDIVLQAGDTLFVDRFPVFYIYGEAQRPGTYRDYGKAVASRRCAASAGQLPR